MGQSLGCCADRDQNVEKRPVMRGKHHKADNGSFHFVGRGGVSRLIAENGPSGHEELQNFMKQGSTAERATIFSQDDPIDSPDPMQAIDFWNIGGAKVYSYSGLYLNQGQPSDTAVGVLMLDRYAIQERPGDPSNPLTFWPYRAFYAIPVGVDFAMCKKVGSAGANAGKDCVDEVGSIVNALASLAEVALAEGKKRLMVTADCGYYALALGAFAEGLLKREGWVQSADVAFCCPSFRVRDELDLVLTLGTTQLISSPDPAKNLVSRMDDCAIVYSTADLMGWYGGSVLDKIKAEYPESDSFAHVVCANKGVTWGMMLADCSRAEEAWVWSEVSAQLVEYIDTSMSFIIGMYIGYKVDDVGIRSEEEQAKIDAEDKGLEQGQTIYEGWMQLPVAGKILLEQLIEDPMPVIHFIAPAVQHVQESSLDRSQGPRGDVRGEEGHHDGVDDVDHFKALVFLVGRLKGDASDDSHAEMVLQMKRRIIENAKKILNFNEGKDEVGKDGKHLRENEITVGPRFVSWYCLFQLRINATVLKDSFEAGQVGHAIDGRQIILFDCKFVPGFGKHVADGLTVWTHASHYFWVSVMYGHFAELIQERSGMPIAYCMECTELFSFTNFLQQNGVPTVDNINLMYIASKSSGNPLKYERYSGHSSPAAMLTDAGMSRWFRRNTLPLRTPDHDREDYIDTREYVFPGKAGKRKLMDKSPTIKSETWDKLVKPEFHFSGTAMSIGRNSNLYVESVELCNSYLANQYVPGRDGQWRGKVELSP